MISGQWLLTACEDLHPVICISARKDDASHFPVGPVNTWREPVVSSEVVELLTLYNLINLNVNAQ